MEKLDEKKKKLMKQLSMSEESLNAMRPATTSTAKHIFESADHQNESMNSNLKSISSLEHQKDLVHYCEINDSLVQHLAK